MKKIILFALGMCCLTACTSKEQDQQIREFWMNQLFAGSKQRALGQQMAKVGEILPASAWKRSGKPSAAITEPTEPAAPAQKQKSLKEKLSFSKKPTEKANEGTANHAKQTASSKTTQQAGKTAKPAAKPAPSVLEVTMDDAEVFPGKAPYDDRVRIKKAYSNLQVKNQTVLYDIRKTFGDDVYSQAFLITVQTEQQLKKAAKTAASYTAYITQQRKLSAKQDQDIQQLLQQNTKSIRYVK